MNKTRNQDNFKPPRRIDAGKVSLFAERWLNNQKGRRKTEQEGTPAWPKSPPSIYALPLLDRPGDRASGYAAALANSPRFVFPDSVCYN